MTVPQFGIFAQGTIAHEFIEFDLRPDVDMGRATVALSQLRAPGVSAGGINLVIGFGSELWRSVAPEHAPAQLAPFTPVGRLGGHHAPATQHDFWLWISGSSRDVVDEAGEELPIYRRSVPYGTVAEHGLYFVAFSADRTRFDRMLARMFGVDADRIHDHLTDFSRPVSGSFYFAPSLTVLAEQAERWAAVLDPVAMAEEPVSRPA